MPFSLADITNGKSSKPPRIILIGPEKIGKSTFASQAPAPVFMQVKGETGLDEIAAPRFTAIHAFEQTEEIFAALADQDQYKTLAIDSLTTLEPLLLDYAVRKEGCGGVTKLGGGYGAQEGVLVSHARRFMDGLDYLRDERSMGCILILHVKSTAKTVNDPETEPYDSWKPQMRESLLDAFCRWADVILFASFRKYTTTKEIGAKKITHAIGNGERVMYTEKRPAFTAGSRYKIPFELPFSYQSLHDAIAAASKS